VAAFVTIALVLLLFVLGLIDNLFTSEIMQLPDREGFVKRAGSPDWTRVKFPYQDFSS
jgi:hypothetical protein